MSSLVSGKPIHNKDLVSKSVLLVDDLLDELGDDSGGATGRFITNDGFIFRTLNNRNFITTDIT